MPSGSGLNLELLPSVFVDISANYRFNDSAELDNEATDIDTDTVFLGSLCSLTEEQADKNKNN